MTASRELPDPGGLAADRELMEEFARSVLEASAPEELAIFEETAEDYFRDPDVVLDPPRRDEAVGFGLDLALLTPYLLAIATPVLSFLLQTVATAAKDETTPVVTELVRRLFRRVGLDRPDAGGPAGPATPAPPVALTPDQAGQVREVALARAADLGLPAEQARLLADSVVGGLVVSG